MATGRSSHKIRKSSTGDKATPQKSRGTSSTVTASRRKSTRKSPSDNQKRTPDRGDDRTNSTPPAQEPTKSTKDIQDRETRLIVEFSITLEGPGRAYDMLRVKLGQMLDMYRHFEESCCIDVVDLKDKNVHPKLSVLADIPVHKLKLKMHYMHFEVDKPWIWSDLPEGKKRQITGAFVLASNAENFRDIFEESKGDIAGLGISIFEKRLPCVRTRKGYVLGCVKIDLHWDSVSDTLRYALKDIEKSRIYAAEKSRTSAVQAVYTGQDKNKEMAQIVLSRRFPPSRPGKSFPGIPSGPDHNISKQVLWLEYAKTDAARERASFAN